MVNKKFKDRLFRALFNDKANALSLYNAIHGTSYDNVEDLEITTIDDVIYMGFKNDLSFMFMGYLNLYEHQSTINRNLPLRGLIYFAKLFEKYIASLEESEKCNLYGTRLIPLPTPKFVVFYNGMDEWPDQELRLSDAFTHPDQADLEVKVRIININEGRNEDLKAQCQVLSDYSALVAKTREKKPIVGIQKAVEEAVDECIDEGILSEFLVQHKAEVTEMLLTEYDEAKTMKAFYADGVRDGREEGHAEGHAEGLAEGRAEGHAEGKKDALISLVKKDLLSVEVAAGQLGVSVEAFKEKMGK